MIRTIIKFNTNINYIITGKDTALHSALDTGVNSRDIFLRNSTADNLVNEFVTLADAVFIKVRHNTNLNMTVLT